MPCASAEVPDLDIKDRLIRGDRDFEGAAGATVTTLPLVYASSVPTIGIAIATVFGIGAEWCGALMLRRQEAGARKAKLTARMPCG